MQELNRVSGYSGKRSSIIVQQHDAIGTWEVDRQKLVKEIFAAAEEYDITYWKYMAIQNFKNHKGIRIGVTFLCPLPLRSNSNNQGPRHSVGSN